MLLLLRSNAEVAEFLIKQGCDVTIANKTGQTASHLAATKGCVPILNLLLSKGADFNTQVGLILTKKEQIVFSLEILWLSLNLLAQEQNEKKIMKVNDIWRVQILLFNVASHWYRHGKML